VPTLLIDGYNVMHALGYLSQRTPANQLESARRRFLDFLAERVAGRNVNCAVVFDAANAPAHVLAEIEYKGLTVYSAKRQEADDLIEDLIRRHSAPKQLLVVSNDRRLRRAAERRGSMALGSTELLDWLDRPAAPEQSEEQEDRGAGAADDWLREFGHLDKDPTLGGPSPFSDDDPSIR